MCYSLVEAGYFISLAKSQSIPLTCERFLGFVCDSVRQALIIPQDKRNKFATLREDTLSSDFVSLRLLKRFLGKVISFSLSIPGSKLYVREVFKAVSRHSGSSRPTVKLEANPRADIVYWRFLDDWKDCFGWRSEHHASVTLYSDTSKTAWGGTLRLSSHTLESRDYCLDNSQHINVLGAQPLLHSLLSFREHLTFSGVDVHTGNRVLKSSLENGGCRSCEVSSVLEDILHSCRKYSFSLDVYYVPTVKIQPISLPEPDQIRIACCQIAPGSKSNAFSSPASSISYPWIVPASAIGWACTYLILRLLQLQNIAVSTSSLILFLWMTISACSRLLSL